MKENHPEKSRPVCAEFINAHLLKLQLLWLSAIKVPSLKVFNVCLMRVIEDSNMVD